MNAHYTISLGAGVQSTYLYLLAMDGNLKYIHRDRDQWGRTISKEWRPLPIEMAIFADTGDEPAPVYRHLEWLQSLNGPPIVVARAYKRSLGEILLSGVTEGSTRFISIPAHMQDGSGGRSIGRRQCSREFKVAVVEKAIRRQIFQLQPRQRMPKDAQCIVAIGMSADEERRVGNVMGRKKPWEIPVFPLYDMGLTRSMVQRELAKRNIPHVVPRSACTFCPYRSNREWLNLKTEDPAGFTYAATLDNRIRGNTSQAATTDGCSRGLNAQQFLHRSCRPISEIDFAAEVAKEDAAKHAQPELFDNFDNECQGICGV